MMPLFFTLTTSTQWLLNAGVERHLRHLLPSSLRAIPPLWQVSGDIRSQKEGAANVAADGSRAAPPAITRARLAELPPAPGINWGVLMDLEWINWWLSYFAVLTQCALTTQHTHLHEHCGAMQMFTAMSWFAFLCKKTGLAINLAS